MRPSLYEECNHKWVLLSKEQNEIYSIHIEWCKFCGSIRKRVFGAGKTTVSYRYPISRVKLED